MTIMTAVAVCPVEMESAGIWNGTAWHISHMAMTPEYGFCSFSFIVITPQPHPAILSWLPRTKKVDCPQPGSVRDLPGVRWNWLEQIRPDLWPLLRGYIKRAGGSETDSFWRSGSLWSLPVLWKKAVRESTQWLLKESLWKIGLMCIFHLEPSGGPVRHRGAPHLPV